MNWVPRRRAPKSAIIAAAVISLLLSACSTGRPASSPTWVPQQDFQANTDPQPQLPGNGLPAPNPSAPGSGAPQPSQPGSPGGTTPSPSGGQDPAVVATKLSQPTGLALLPDGTALVGERTTGRILQVQPIAGRPVRLVQRITGIDATGDGGLLDLAVSPNYPQDGLIYAYITTPTDNRVVYFTIGSAPTVVVAGIPKGRTGNVGRIVFDATGALLIGTGDAGTPARATDPTSLAGKILRVSDIGQPAVGNPTKGSPIYASGFRSLGGLCVDASDGLRVAISPGNPDAINPIAPGHSYAATPPAAVLPNTIRGAAGCAVVNGQLIVATTTGKALATASISATGSIGSFTALLRGKYGRLRTVVAGRDGTLWLTTTNRDGKGTPVSTDDRVVHISASDSGASSTL